MKLWSVQVSLRPKVMFVRHFPVNVILSPMSLMKRRRMAALGLVCAGLLLLFGRPAATAAPAAQVDTPTQPAWRVEAFEFDVTVRAGACTCTDNVGVIIPGQSSQILGRSPDNQWLQIVYLGGPDNTGWVFREFVRVTGDLSLMPTVDPPPTPTLPPTPLPVFAETPGAAGTATRAAGENRPPTFTAPAVGIRPTLLPVQGLTETPGFPPALLIGWLLVLGTFGGLVSLLRQR